jgi:hypothetical protein
VHGIHHQSVCQRKVGTVVDIEFSAPRGLIKTATTVRREKEQQQHVNYY